MCELNVKREHVCSNYKESSGNMEAVGAFRIFERSLSKRDLKYTEYYGDGDSKGFLKVKDIYGENSVTKLECIGHIQKRVGSRLRKLKKNTKGLGGKGKLTDKFIDKLQNYYGIAIRSNVGCLEKMQSAVIAAFFHCCSSNQNPMHGQCPTGKDSWCKYKQALRDGQMVFGGVECETDSCFLIAVHDRTAETLLGLIESWIETGTTVIFDCWKSYEKLSEREDEHQPLTTFARIH
ncbi:uncharacterized protein TNCV_3849041 [Trichonephila clavipes]|uniref:ISXO2-like transposase domain-containing protein n=1 Tax=Trichonephila clavipes TaxID=2585209 RepID=A0A8X6V227_TRICX|nr:uncharacterized protein TNCV_3849041 [Trichonephila clavipes]